MNSRESIVLAEKLKKGYGDLEKMGQEICDKEAFLERPIEPVKDPMPDNSTFDQVVGTVLTTLVVCLIIGIELVVFFISAMMDFREISGERHQTSAFKGIVIVDILLLVVVLSVKYIRERNKKLYLEEYRKKQEIYSVRRREEMQQALDELKDKYAKLKEELSRYDDLVPINFRNKNCMVKVASLLSCQKAQDFTEAISFLAKG